MAIGLVVIVATAITITTVNGLKNSQFSQNQAQATKLAQEGIEQVKTIRNRNCPVEPTPLHYWSSDPLIWGTLSSVTYFEVILTSTECKLKSSTSAGVTISGTVFTKKLSLINETTKQIRVVSEVTWTDLSGTHSSKQETILADY